MQMLVVASHWIQHRPVAVDILEPRIMTVGVVLLELHYCVGIKQSDIRHHRSLQNVLMLKTT